MTSPLKFKYESTELNTDEATALLSLADNKNDLVIDLSQVIKVSARTATEMFNLAVQQKNPVLASLAARMAIESPAKVDRRISKPQIVEIKSTEPLPSKQAKKNALKLLLETPIEGPIDSIIAALLQRNSRWAAGAVSILTFAPGKTVNIYRTITSKTLKEIAIDQNLELMNQGVAFESAAFKGFEIERNGVINILDSTDVDRNQSYFTSPTYNALREGLIFCKTNKLVEVEKGVSVGAIQSQVKDDYPPTQHLERTFWKVRLSAKGEELMKQWNDSVDFLVRFWSSRLEY